MTASGTEPGGPRISSVLDAIQELVERDARFLALFLTGSQAEGRADEHSDLDLLAVVPETDVKDVAADLPSTVDEIAPLVDVSIRMLGGSALLNLVTEQCLRIDVIVASPEHVAQSPRYGSARRLFDRAGVEGALPEVSGPVVVAHGEEWFDSLVKGVLRTVALLPMIVDRGELIRGGHHVQLLKQDFLELLLFAEGDPPLTRPGTWAWSGLQDRLSSERRRQVEALPPAAMTRPGVIDGHLHVLAAFLDAARQVGKRAGFVWKHTAYEKAVRDHLARAGYSS